MHLFYSLFSLRHLFKLNKGKTCKLFFSQIEYQTVLYLYTDSQHDVINSDLRKQRGENERLPGGL